MKKIGILFGQERTFPAAFVEHGRANAPSDVQFEFVRWGETQQGRLSEYDVILDRISQDVPFYRSALKHAALKGTAVINNPFWWSAEDKLSANVLAQEVGVPVPKTVLLPSRQHPEDTTSDSFTNLEYPLQWDSIFDHIGFPAFMKPNTGGGWKHVYKVHSPEELWSAYNETEQLNMLLQEAVDFTTYYRCYCIGGKHVRVMKYEPRNVFHERYVNDGIAIEPKLLKTLEDYVVRLCDALGYDFNTVELAVRDGIPYAIDFTNPAPDADVNSVGQENFDWVVKYSVDYAIERAQQHTPGGDNLTWGSFMKRSVQADMKASAPRVVAKKKPAAKKPAAVKVSPSQAKAVVAPKVKDQPVVLSAKEAKANTKELLTRLGKAAKGAKDDLKVIKGVGPKLEGILNGLGILTYEQVGKMKVRDYDLVDSLLTTFKGRGKRDEWSKQAKKLK
ncbi:MAG: hypothetical protein AB8F78_14750 [Saprospiraceae bacterium]